MRSDEPIGEIESTENVREYSQRKDGLGQRFRELSEEKQKRHSIHQGGTSWKQGGYMGQKTGSPEPGERSCCPFVEGQR